jgi:hypothetical protein
MLKRRLVLLGMGAALASTASAQAATTVQQLSFDAAVTICNLDTVQLTGTLLVTTSTTVTSSGGLIVAVHFQPQGVSGIDTTTGTVFRAGGLTRDLYVSSPPGGATATFVNRFHIQATNAAESFIVNVVFHVTVTPDGSVAVIFGKASSTCA